MSRFRQNFLYGTASGVLASSSQLTITGTNFPTNIPVGSYMPIIINPGYIGSSNTTGPEVVYIVNGTTSTVAQVSGRAMENSVLASGNNIPWLAGPLVSDFTLSSGIVNGDFPAPTASGQYLQSISTTNAAWASGIPTQTFATVTALGTNQATGAQLTAQFSQVNGATATSGSGSGTGVILPVPSLAGQQVTVDNNSTTNWLVVYPSTGANIDNAGSNSPIYLPPNGYWRGTAGSLTNWATAIPAIIGASGTNVTYSNGNVIISSAPTPSGINTVTNIGSASSSLSSSFASPAPPAFSATVTGTGYRNYLVIMNGTIVNQNTTYTNMQVNIGFGINSTSVFYEYFAFQVIPQYNANNGGTPYSCSFVVNGLTPSSSYSFNTLAATSGTNVHMYYNQMSVIGLS